MLASARKGDGLAVFRLDRLGRSLGELLAVTMLKERGIALLSLEEKLDTSSAAGELVFHVLGAIAHFERRLIAGGPATASPPAARAANYQVASRSMPAGSALH